jgi:hypothetical protein
MNTAFSLVSAAGMAYTRSHGIVTRIHRHVGVWRLLRPRVLRRQLGFFRGAVGRALQGNCERVEVTADMVDLRDAYLAAQIVTARYGDDALHVAQATIAHADVIVSWNFKHLVNPLRIRGFNQVNTKQGYGEIVILTPADIVRMLEAGL